MAVPWYDSAGNPIRILRDLSHMDCRDCRAYNSMIEYEGDWMCRKCGVVRLSGMPCDQPAYGEAYGQEGARYDSGSTCSDVVRGGTSAALVPGCHGRAVRAVMAAPAAAFTADTPVRDSLVQQFQQLVARYNRDNANADQQLMDAACGMLRLARTAPPTSADSTATAAAGSSEAQQQHHHQQQHNPKGKRAAAVMAVCLYCAALRLSRGIALAKAAEMFDVTPQAVWSEMPAVLPAWSGQRWYPQVVEAMREHGDQLCRAVYALDFVPRGSQWSLIKATREVHETVKGLPGMGMRKSATLVACCIWIALQAMPEPPVAPSQGILDLLCRASGVSAATVRKAEAAVQSALTVKVNVP